MARTATRRSSEATKAERDAQAREFQRDVDAYSRAHRTKTVGKAAPTAPTPISRVVPAPPAAESPPAFVNPRQIHQAIKGGSGGTVAGIALGALAFFTLRAFLVGGWPGVKAFYAAKFLNKTSAAPNPVPAATSSGSSSTGSTATTKPKAPAGGGTSARGSTTSSTTPTASVVLT